MPPQTTASQQVRLKTLFDSFSVPCVDVIAERILSLAKSIETIKRNKRDCIQILEQTHNLLDAIIILHIKSDTGGELPPGVLKGVNKFTGTLRKIQTFVEAQHNGSRVKRIFRQGEMSRLLQDCRIGLQQGLDFFQVKTANLIKDIAEMQQDAEYRHQEVLNMINALPDAGSDRASTYGHSIVL
ncbi:hypothetical protein B0H13DRAFT_2393285 [Mycena leptocephala]|nr:hypothetical protein B0H13DRAFT_2393285 [Mycena leptocephala]